VSGSQKVVDSFCPCTIFRSFLQHCKASSSLWLFDLHSRHLPAGSVRGKYHSFVYFTLELLPFRTGYGIGIPKNKEPQRMYFTDWQRATRSGHGLRRTVWISIL
jgi:hypothetical protein